MGHALGNNYGKFYAFQQKPVILDLEFTVNAADTGGLGVTGVKGQGVSTVFMHTSQTPGKGPNGITNPNPAVGLAWIQLAYNYSRLYSGPWNIQSPVTGSNLAINGSALTAGQPYQITAVGSGTAGACTIAPVADVSGSLASTNFFLFDAYGNTFCIWFYVTGVGGTAPTVSRGVTLVQQTIAQNATAGTIGSALASTIALLPSGISGVYSFTTSGTTTVTCTSTTSTPIAGVPQDSSSAATGFTFALTKYTTNLTDWQKVGLPAGVTPAVGASFIATAAGYSTGGGSSGTVKAIGVSGITTLEIVGFSNQAIAPGPVGPSAFPGGWVLVQFLGATNSSTTTLIPTAPADTSVVRMNLLLEQASRVGGNNE